MSSVKISADSTSDLSPELIRRLKINIVPLTITCNNESYKDGVEITREELFRRCETEKLVWKTAAVNEFDYRSCFEEMTADGSEVVHVCISSEMSSCYQNACAAADDFPNVYVIDSKNLSSAIGHLVLDAALMAQDGASGKKIAERLTIDREKLEASFVLNTLEYLKRGGRCSAIKAFSAAVLKLKPCIEVVDGKMTVGETYRGSLESCLKHYIKDRLKGRTDIDPRRVFITHSGCDRETFELAKNFVIKYGCFEEITETPAGCSISTHCGPNTLGILFYRK